MFLCEFCQKEFFSRESLGGHRSGHVRRGEIPKEGFYHKKILSCRTCNEVFESGFERRHHEYVEHIRTLENCKSSGAKKEVLLHLLGHQCQVCLLSEWMSKPVPIEMDHIDGNPENEVRENLRLICPNCHAQTDTYKGKNVGKVKNSKRAGVLRRSRGKYR